MQLNVQLVAQCESFFLYMIEAKQTKASAERHQDKASFDDFFATFRKLSWSKGNSLIENGKKIAFCASKIEALKKVFLNLFVTTRYLRFFRSSSSQ